MREICNAEWDDIQDRLKEQDATIERLKAELIMAQEHWEMAKQLIIEATDALDYQLEFINRHCCDGYPSCSELIAQLRKAAG